MLVWGKGKESWWVGWVRKSETKEKEEGRLDSFVSMSQWDISVDWFQKGIRGVI